MPNAWHGPAAPETRSLGRCHVAGQLVSLLDHLLDVAHHVEGHLHGGQDGYRQLRF